MPTDVGTGATIAFSSSLFAEILSIDFSGLTREAVDTTKMSTTTSRTFIPGDLYDPGELTVELNFDQDGGYLAAASAAPATVTVQLPDGAGTAQWTASGFLTNLDWTAPLEDKMTATATLKLTGNVGVA